MLRQGVASASAFAISAAIACDSCSKSASIGIGAASVPIISSSIMMGTDG